MAELDGKVDLKWALEAIQYESEIPHEVKVALKAKQHKTIRASLIQGHEEQPDADTMVKLNRARELLNKLYEQNQLKLDNVIWDCRVYLTAQQELMDENTRLRTIMGAAAARAKGLQLEASAMIKVAKGELEELTAALRKLNGECDVSLANLREQERIAALDYDAGMMILNATEKTCDAKAAAGTAMVSVKTCMKQGADAQDEDGDDLSYEFDKMDFSDMEANFETPLAKAAMHRMLKLSIERQEEEHPEDYALLQFFSRDAIRARRLGKVPSTQAPGDGAPVPAPAPPGMEAKEAPPPDLPAQPKCSVDNANCPVLLDQVSTMVGAILGELQQIRKQLAKQELFCKTGIAKYEAQIKTWEGTKDEENVKLAEAIEVENTNTESLRQKVMEYKLLKGAFDDKTLVCNTKKTAILNTLCGLKIVRIEVYNNEGVEGILIQDCEVGDWVDNDCSVTCAGGTQSVTRDVLQEAGPDENPGAKCPPVSRMQDCNPDPCPIDCVMEDWSEWTACSKDCGTGIKQKSRSVTIEATNGGDACGDTDMAEKCNVGACDVDCVVAPWAPWEQCTKMCNGGIETRRKPVFDLPKGMGECGDENSDTRFEERACNARPCPPNLVCNSKVDIVIVLDASGSVRQPGFDQEKIFARRLVERLNMGGDGAKVGLIRFSTKISPLSMMTYDKATLLGKIDDMTFDGRRTATSKAMSTAVDLLKAGGRKEVEKKDTIVFLVTDGVPNDPGGTDETAKLVRDAARLVVVPVGTGMGKAGLESMTNWASFPEEQNTLAALDFTTLSGMVATFMSDLCADLTCRETFEEADQSDYIGCQTQTVSGLTCMPWMEVDEEKWSTSGTTYALKKVTKGRGRRKVSFFPPETIAANVLGGTNFCRNPGKKPEGIWCFTTSTDTPWEHCDPRASNATGW